MEKSPDKSWAYSTTEEGAIKLIPYRNIDAIGPAGSINSCANDMANWLMTWINNGKFNDKEIIPPTFRNQAISMQVATGGGLPGSENPDLHLSGYGLAWGMSSYRGHYRVEHGGGIDGFITSTSFFPSDSIGIFIVSNQNGPTTSIRNYIVDRMLGLSYRNWSDFQLYPMLKARKENKMQNTDSMQQAKGTKPSHAIADYAGSFENKGYGIAKLFMERDTLWLDYNEGGLRTKAYLQHYHYDVFRARSTEETKENFDAPKLNFYTNNKGEIEGFKTLLEPSVKEIDFKRKATTVTLSKQDLQKYTGEYSLNGVAVSVYIKGDNTLMVLIPGQPDYELVASDEHLFRLKIMDGYNVKFDMNENNESTGLSFIQPNGTFKATKKK
jgi:hypothetical protein